MTLIDTAEMYGGGGAEEVFADAVSGRRDEVFLVSKFYPHLLHWRGSVPLQEIFAGFDALVRAGKIRYWAVSNFDLGDIEALVSLPMGSTVAANQIPYNLLRRGIEWDLLPWCRKRNIPIMAYSPVKRGRLLDHPTFIVSLQF